MSLKNTVWLKLLTEAVEKSSKQAVADELGVSRTTISLVMNDKYPASTDKIEALVMALYSRVDCPHLSEQITITQCKRHHSENAPTSSPRAMRLWRACQSCPNNGEKSGAKYE